MIYVVNINKIPDGRVIEGGRHASLMICDIDTNRKEVDEFVELSDKYDSKLIIIWGENSDEIEGIIDDHLEMCGKLDIVTTSHLDESAEDIANYVFYGSLLDESRFDLVIFYREKSEAFRSLVEALSQNVPPRMGPR